MKKKVFRERYYGVQQEPVEPVKEVKEEKPKKKRTTKKKGE